jgi:hypothetical protein
VLEAGILVEDAEGYRLDGPLAPLAIPATLQDSLMARLDRLAPVREIGQIGAAIGREFSYLLCVLVGRDEIALKNALAQPEQAELVFRRGEPPEAVYSFKHALVHESNCRASRSCGSLRARRLGGTRSPGITFGSGPCFETTGRP